MCIRDRYEEEPVPSPCDVANYGLYSDILGRAVTGHILNGYLPIQMCIRDSLVSDVFTAADECIGPRELRQFRTQGEGFGKGGPEALPPIALDEKCAGFFYVAGGGVTGNASFHNG